MTLGTVLVDRKDENIIAQVIDEYKYFYLVEVHATSGYYKETVRIDDFERGDSRWREL
jgi:hypothetical protein